MSALDTEAILCLGSVMHTRVRRGDARSKRIRGGVSRSCDPSPLGFPLARADWASLWRKDQSFTALYIRYTPEAAPASSLAGTTFLKRVFRSVYTVIVSFHGVGDRGAFVCLYMRRLTRALCDCFQSVLDTGVDRSFAERVFRTHGYCGGCIGGRPSCCVSVPFIGCRSVLF